MHHQFHFTVKTSLLHKMKPLGNQVSCCGAQMSRNSMKLYNYYEGLRRKQLIQWLQQITYFSHLLRCIKFFPPLHWNATNSPVASFSTTKVKLLSQKTLLTLSQKTLLARPWGYKACWSKYKPVQSHHTNFKGPRRLILIGKRKPYYIYSVFSVNFAIKCVVFCSFLI